MAERISGKQQIAEVKKRYPQLEVLSSGPELIIWEGWLAGFSKQYKVRIFWHRFPPGEDLLLLNTSPRVIVLAPSLLPRGDDRVPHTYSYSLDRTQICCWDPASPDWGGNLLVSETIIPYVEQWLCSYELWRVSGVWPAPGRHPSMESSCETPTLTSCPDLPARSTRRASAKIGQLIGTSASLALMAVASEESYRWPRWRDWKESTFVAAV